MVTRKEIDSSSEVRTLRDAGMDYVLTTESLSCPRLYAQRLPPDQKSWLMDVSDGLSAVGSPQA